MLLQCKTITFATKNDGFGGKNRQFYGQKVVWIL
jgi:hypothetical protein